MRNYYISISCFLIITLFPGLNMYAQKDPYQILILKKNKAGVHALDYHPDGTKILIGTGAHKVKLWDYRNGKTRFEIPLTREVYAVLWLPGGRYFLANAGTVIQLFTAEGVYHNQLRGHNTAIWSMDTDAMGEFLVSGSFSRAYKIWNIPEITLVETVVEHSKSVLAVCFSPDGTRIASGSLDETIHIREFPSGKFLASALAHTENIYDLEYHPSGTFLASASRDQSIKFWDQDSAKMIRKLDGHDGAVFSISFSPDGYFLLSGSEDQTIKLWDVQSGNLIYTFTGHEGAVNEVLFNPDGTDFASGSMDGTVRIWAFDPEIIVNYCCKEAFLEELNDHELFKPHEVHESKNDYNKRVKEQQKFRSELATRYYELYLERLRQGAVK